MNVYSKYTEVQEFLKSQDIEGISVVDDPRDSHYIISGQYSEKDYGENLKGIIIPYTGHNGINLDDLRKRNLKLFVTPVRSKYVAEKAIMLTLSLLGNIINYHNNMTKGDWSERNTDLRVPWVSIQNMKIGLFGYGRIGKLIHQMLKGFDCEFYTIDRLKQYKEIKLVKNLKELVLISDIVIISVPLNSETENIIGEEILSLMSDKYLINVGRGKIVNQEALYKSLVSNKLKGYASDVWYNYPKGEESSYPSDYPIHELKNVVMSNHSGGYTVNTEKEVNQALIEQLIRLRDEDFTGELDLRNLI